MIHEFLHCDFAGSIWYVVCLWLGVVTVLPADMMMSYGLLVDSGRNKRIRKGISIVWVAFVWVIWRCRNDRIFNNVVGMVADTMDQIQRLSWQWYLSMTVKDACLLYEWIWDPGECMVRGWSMLFCSIWCVRFCFYSCCFFVVVLGSVAIILLMLLFVLFFLLGGTVFLCIRAYCLSFWFFFFLLAIK
jgi:hypothetical protein